jgi:hypothetical protein
MSREDLFDTGDGVLVTVTCGCRPRDCDPWAWGVGGAMEEGSRGWYSVGA